MIVSVIIQQIKPSSAVQALILGVMFASEIQLYAFYWRRKSLKAGLTFYCTRTQPYSRLVWLKVDACHGKHILDSQNLGLNFLCYGDLSIKKTAIPTI